MSNRDNMNEISVEELKQKLDHQDNIQILDVRALSEYQFCNLGGLHIPLGELSYRLSELDKNQSFAVLCHRGGRSAQATFMLQNAHFKDVKNITGGIAAWSSKIDPEVPVY